MKLYITEDKGGINWIKIGDVNPDDIYITKTEEKITKVGAVLSGKQFMSSAEKMTGQLTGNRFWLTFL